MVLESIPGVLKSMLGKASGTVCLEGTWEEMLFGAKEQQSELVGFIPNSATDLLCHLEKVN